MAIESPLKLSTAYNPVQLYNFDGNAGLDEGSLGHDIGTVRGNAYWGLGHEHGTKALYFTPALGIEGSSPAPAAARIIGDLTLQTVVRFANFGIGSFGSEIISCKGTAASEPENICYTFTLANDATQMRPQFQWEYGAGSTRVTIENTAFTFTTHRWYHVVMRRTDVGSGNSLGEIIVNKRLVASATDVSASGGTNAFMKMGLDSGGFVALPGAIVSSAKINNRALTDAEIAAEFNRVQEAIR